MRFGINIRNRLTGADLYVRILQIASILPVLYVLVACVHPAVYTSRNVASVLFDLGMSTLPRWEALVLSRLYQVTRSEVLVCAALLVLALIFGLAAGRLLKGTPGKASAVRIILAALIVSDLVIRVLPLSFRAAYGIPAAAIGFAVRLGCLLLILGDLLADRRDAREQGH